MTAATIALAALTPLLAAPAADDTKDKPPEGPAPKFVTVEKYDKDKDILQARAVEQVAVTEAVPVKVVIMGREATEIRSVTRMVSRAVVTAHALKGSQFFDGAGKKLKDDEARDRLKAGRTVLLAPTPQAPDPAYLKVLAKDTLIIAPGPPEPAPMPPPRP
jgi:hypothetical protein